MPLPAANTPWPPPGFGAITESVRRWDAWYQADPAALRMVYGGANNVLPAGYRDFAAQYRGGVVGAVARMFWGEPMRPDQRSPKLHVPLAQDIASTSANLLFGEPPTVTVDDEAAQARLDELLDDRTWLALLNGAEVCAGLGTVYLRVGWDETVAARPLLSVIAPDVATPVFRWGLLAEVIFTWTLARAKGKVLRHLELHTPGRVEHALYEGDDESLGRVVPLAEHPDTAALMDSVDEQGVVATGLDRLDVIYVPNQPHRGWRNHPVGMCLGQPDIAGVEPILDALDETWTSWLRDVRLGKARAVVPQTYLESAGRGQGALFDLDRELFVGVNALPATDQMPLKVVQTVIRHGEHAATAAGIMEQAIGGAGYSAQTFGLTGDVAMTATEAQARERKTAATRAAKVRRWGPALADLAELMLAVDRVVFGSPILPVRPDVEFPKVWRDSPTAVAQIVSMIIESASLETRVRMLHPDWDDDQVAAEVAAVEDATPDPPPDPFAMAAAFNAAPPAVDTGAAPADE